jgi:hypothetical protein
VGLAWRRTPANEGAKRQRPDATAGKLWCDPGALSGGKLKFMSSPENVKADAVQHVVELLRIAPKPLTFGQLKEQAHMNEGVLRSVLEVATAHGGAFRWPDYRRLQYFWSQSAEQAARQALLEESSKLAFFQTKLIEQARKRVPGFSKKAMQLIVASLVAEGHLQKVDAFSTGKLLIKHGESAAYATYARDLILKKCRKAGLDPSAFFASLMPREDKPAPVGSANAPELLLNAVRSLQPSEGVPVTAHRLRNQLSILGKSEFDAAALKLRRNQQVFLALHHDPFSLPQTERDLLIDGGDGTYYVSIAIR